MEKKIARKVISLVDIPLRKFCNEHECSSCEIKGKRKRLQDAMNEWIKEKKLTYPEGCRYEFAIFCNNIILFLSLAKAFQIEKSKEELLEEFLMVMRKQAAFCNHITQKKSWVFRLSC